MIKNIAQHQNYNEYSNKIGEFGNWRMKLGNCTYPEWYPFQYSNHNITSICKNASSIWRNYSGVHSGYRWK